MSAWLGSRVVSVLDSGAEGPGFKSQPRRCRVTVLGKLFTPIVPLFTSGPATLDSGTPYTITFHTRTIYNLTVTSAVCVLAD